VLNVDAPVTAGQTVTFDTWYWIEEGWDYGFVEALVDGEWVSVPVYDADGNEITTDDDPHQNNEEGNGITGTSGGEYFVDYPELLTVHTGPLPEGTSDVRFRYSTDAAYVDTGWFVKDVLVDETATSLSSPADNWVYTLPEQVNNWSVQIVSPCDLTPGETLEGETTDSGRYIYQFESAEISQSFTQCTTKERFTVVISNMTGGPVDTLDAPYRFRITNTAAKGNRG